MKTRSMISPEKKTAHGERGCDWPGCTGAGEHRAPRSRNELRTYYWFCLQHVRLYNKNWNYYEGLDDAQVEADMRRDTTWARPTWPLGGGPGARAAAGFSDPLGVFEAMHDTDGAGGGERTERKGTRYGAEAPFATKEEDAQRVLEITGPVTTEIIKASYKRLVKQHHPDANGGDKQAEERIKEINAAYRTLMDSLGGRDAR